MDPSTISQGVGNFFNSAVFGSTLKYVSYFMYIAVAGLAMYVAYLMMQYRYKIIYPELHYSADGTTARILRLKKDRARVVQKKDGRKFVHLFWLRKKIEPFKPKDVLPGRRVNILKIHEDGTYMPMPHLVFNSPGEFATLTPEEKWTGLLLSKDIVQEFQNPELQRRIMAMTMITAIVCLVVVVATVYLCLKAPGKVVASIDKAIPSLERIAGNLGGAPR